MLHKLERVDEVLVILVFALLRLIANNVSDLRGDVGIVLRIFQDIRA